MTIRKILFTVSFPALSILFTTSSNGQAIMSSDFATAQKTIEENNQKYFDALANNDSALFKSLYTPDCWIMAPNTGVFCGVEAANDYFMQIRKTAKIQEGVFITIDVYGVSENIIAEVGFYRLFNNQHKAIDDGKYIVLWKKANNTWKRFRDSYSSSHDTN